MYTNIGAKIKGLAKFIAYVGIAGSVITSFILIGGEAIGTGLGVLVGGSLISWIGSWFMYGFGELIEKTTDIAKNTTKDSSTEAKHDN